ncbi:type 1 glutamine amidotransferase [Caulobacter sp. RHG1]|uniref:glutamine amidotransferase-related protein n=1 Tax=Caulobacter sp. (strain RHG1) TaxID=2545762 RepID=UPI0015528714|nr:type 1 glutamine amidotransferase [Caulobacter sp. RHG1]NQE65068.1 Glutamine amidotransferase, class I [Caulobacter sp. RHG1]
MKIGLLETGEPPGDLLEKYGSYSAMFEALLGDGHVYRVYDVQKGELPSDPAENDAYVVTGSAAGVYDPLPWIEPLKSFLRDAKGATPLVGVCFGHQIMAEAFGGKVEKSDKGWGVGLQAYEVAEHAPWMDGARHVSVPGSHQDQVVELAPGARVLAGSAFTPYGVLAYDDAKAISMQFHPEFTPAYAKALIEARRGTRFTDEQADAAIASLGADNDRDRLASWISRFLEQAT